MSGKSPQKEKGWPCSGVRAEQDTHDFPHGLGWHARVTVHQGLCGLGEGVGDAVAETLSQTGPAMTAGGEGAQGRCCSSQQRQRFHLPLRQRQDTVLVSCASHSPQSHSSATSCLQPWAEGGSVPVLDGFGLAAAVPHDLGDVLGLAPGALVREEGELVYGRWGSQEQRWEQGPHHEP